MPGRTPRLCLAIADWPMADRALWVAAEENGSDPFAAMGRRRLAPATRETYIIAWRRFLGFLSLCDPRALEILPADRFTVSRVRAFAAHLSETNAPQSVAGQIGALYNAVRHVLPNTESKWLKDITVKLQSRTPTDKTRPIVTSVQLLQVGLQLMDEGRAVTHQPIILVDAVKFRNGLMIAFLAFVPLRKKNLAEMQLGHHLVRHEDGWAIVFSSSETKTSTPIEFAIPNLLNEYIDFYLDAVRVRMLRERSNSVWVGVKGGALPYSMVWRIIARNTQVRLGIRIAPHDVRHAAATMWALEKPDNIGVARDLLSHTDLRTTTKYYIRANGIIASRSYAQLISRTRKMK